MLGVHCNARVDIKDVKKKNSCVFAKEKKLCVCKRKKKLCVCRKNADACQGDSGGPVVWLNPESERYEQVILGDELPNIYI